MRFTEELNISMETGAGIEVAITGFGDPV